MYIKAYKTQNGTDTLTTYTTINKLSFSPSADLVGASIPVNEFEAQIKTTDTINIGHYAELYDDLDNLWAKYWLIYAEHIDKNTVSIRAQSDVAVLDRIILPAVYYDHADVGAVLDVTIVSTSRAGTSVTMPYTLHESYANSTITGFCPEQTARERLTWICFVIGAYVKTFFNDRIQILPIDSSETMIPLAATYYKPTVVYNDHVTAIRARAFAFAEGEPGTTDEYVTDNDGTVYIMTSSVVTLTNPSAPTAAPDNVIDVGDVYLINLTNVSAILSHLSQWYFKRTEVDLDAIDNAEYIPGDKAAAYTDEDAMCSGYITSADFSFGLQTKARINLVAVENKPTGKLKVVYADGSRAISTVWYVFPVGYAYNITNPYLDETRDGVWRVYRPINASATGTMASGTNTNNQSCTPALVLQRRELQIISVDSFATETEDNITIGVIA